MATQAPGQAVRPDEVRAVLVGFNVSTRTVDRVYVASDRRITSGNRTYRLRGGEQASTAAASEFGLSHLKAFAIGELIEADVYAVQLRRRLAVPMSRIGDEE